MSLKFELTLTLSLVLLPDISHIKQVGSYNATDKQAIRDTDLPTEHSCEILPLYNLLFAFRRPQQYSFVLKF